MRVVTLVASDDATSGSVIPNAERVLASSNGRSHRAFCSGVAQFCSAIMLGTSGAWQLKTSGAQNRRPMISADGAYSRLERRVPGSSSPNSGRPRFHSPAARAFCCRSPMKGAASRLFATCSTQARWRGSTSRSKNACSFARHCSDPWERSKSMLPPAFWAATKRISTRIANSFRYIYKRSYSDHYLAMAAISTIDPSAVSRAKAAVDHADPSFATTLAHGLDVLAAFRNSSGSLSNADLALHTGLSRPTVSRLTYTLAQLGYLKRDAKGRFELGLGLLAAAYPVLSALKVRQLARPLMRDFAAYAGGTVSIAMPFGLDFIYVAQLRTTDAVPHVPDVGFTSTLATTAVGRALLSLFTGDELQSYVRNVKAQRPEEL